MCLDGTPGGPGRRTSAGRRRCRRAAVRDTASEARARGSAKSRTGEPLRRRSAGRPYPAAGRPRHRGSRSAAGGCRAAERGRRGPPAARAGVAGSCSRGTRPGTGRRTRSRSAERSAGTRQESGVPRTHVRACDRTTVIGLLVNEYEWMNDCAAQPPSLQFPTVIPL